MGKTERIVAKVILALIFLVMVFGVYLSNQAHREVVLTIGVYAGSYWDTPSGDSYQVLDEAITRFEAAHPNVKMKYVSGIRAVDYSEWLAEQIVKGKEPDIYYVLPEDFSLLASTGALADLGHLIASDRAVDIDCFYPSCLEAGRYKETLCALPFESVPTIMFVNKTFLQEKGVDFPAGDWTWDDFYAICKEVTSPENHEYGVYNYTWLNALYSNGVSLFADDGSFCNLADSRVLEAIRFVMKLQNLNEGYQVNGRDFDLGKVAFRPFLYSEYRAYQPYPYRVKKYTGFEWEGIPMPAGHYGGNISELHTLLLGLSARTRHKELAWEFLKLLAMDPEIQQNLCRYSSGISPLKSVAESPATVSLLQENIPGGGVFDSEGIHQIMGNAVVIPNFPGYDTVLQMMDKIIIEQMNADNISASTLLSNQREINLFLSKK